MFNANKGIENITYAEYISQEHIEILKEEELICYKVRYAIQQEALKDILNLDEVKEYLNDLKEQASEAHSFDLPAIFDQIHSNLSIVQRNYTRKLPDLRHPYFAHLKLQEENKIKDILIGHQTFLSEDVVIVDWKNAPIAKIFFTYQENDLYEEEISGKEISGKVLAKRAVMFEMGKLLGVSFSGFDYFKDSNLKWHLRTNSITPNLIGGEQSATRKLIFDVNIKKRNYQILSLLDPEQYDLLHQDDKVPLLILGGAGCGKTTVALYRIANLLHKDPQFYAPHKTLVIVPEEGLVRLSKKLLKDLGLEKVNVETFNSWIQNQISYMFNNIPVKICNSTSVRVSKFKKSSAIFKIFPVLEEYRKESIIKKISKHFVQKEEIVNYFKTVSAQNLLERLNLTYDYCFKLADVMKNGFAKKKYLSNVAKIFAELKSSIFDLNIDRYQLFSKPNLLRNIIDFSQGELHPSIADEVYKHSLKQFMPTSDEVFSDVDVEYKTPIDNKGLDEDTPEEVAGTIDIEDYTFMLNLLVYYTGAAKTDFGSLHKYTQMVLDEAQDLAPMELVALRHALESNASVTIAGDMAQQIDPSVTLKNWESVLKDLNISSAYKHELKTSYRSTKQIIKVAYDVLGEEYKHLIPITNKEGPPVSYNYFFDSCSSYVFIQKALLTLFEQEPNASVGILTPNFEIAQEIYEYLKFIENVRFIMNGNFEFTPGVEIAPIYEAKGLEFDYVILPDISAKHYPDTPEARRLLHVGITRAIHQVWLIATQTPSPIIPKYFIED